MEGWKGWKGLKGWMDGRNGWKDGKDEGMDGLMNGCGVTRSCVEFLIRPLHGRETGGPEDIIGYAASTRP